MTHLSRKTTMTLITQELGKEWNIASSEMTGESRKEEGLVIVTDFPPNPPPKESNLQSGISSASAASQFAPPIDHYRQLPGIIKAASTVPAPTQVPTGGAKPFRQLSKAAIKNQKWLNYCSTGSQRDR